MFEEPIVEIKQGKLLGKISADHNGRPYYSFQGIPYAKPPLGELRFKAPQAGEPWIGIQDATKEGNSCYARHMILGTIAGSEDCLYLNVYTPTIEKVSSTLMPVMVWIHGGGFTSGSGSTEAYSPEFLMPHDVVVVSINYRLGLLGFLNFEDPSLGISGNAGLKDQVLALKWVRDNIIAFNGNPENVTIFGESAGGASVHYHILSPMSKGLFHKAIIQSGSALAQFALGLRSVKPLADILNMPEAKEKHVLQQLENMSTEDILKLQFKIPDTFTISAHRKLGPVVETSSHEETFINEHPRDILKSGNYNKVPVIIGYCSREGMLLDLMKAIKPKVYESMHKLNQNVPHDVASPRSDRLFKEVANKIKSFYYGEKDILELSSDSFYLLQTDVHFIKTTFDTARYFVDTLNFPVYIYRMSIETSLNILKQALKVQSAGVCHADDVFYLFKSSITPHFTKHSLEGEAVHRFTKLWTSFAYTGNPNPKEEDPLINVTWLPAEKNKLYYLDINENLTVGVNPDQGRLKFWDEIYACANTGSKL